MATPTTNATILLPIGSVTAYAGDLSVEASAKAIQAAGWLICDGASYATATYPDLFAAIGTSNGSSSTGNFNVPDLRDRFIRGYNGSANGTDPDAATRVEAAPGGATGNNVGSLQKTATALPVNALTAATAGAHTHTIAHLNDDMHMAWSGSTYRMARWNATATTGGAGGHSHTLAGYKQSSDPINVALYFIIKATEVVNDGKLPAGILTGIAGSLSNIPTNWLACDGTAYAEVTYPDLNAAIAQNYGGDGVTVFNVPDLRGKFMRGTSHTTSRDPDAAQRVAQSSGGNTGSDIGSVQSSATLIPSYCNLNTTGAHSHSVQTAPVTDHHAAWGASGFAAYNCMVWTDGLTTTSSAGDHTHTFTGGDTETRPENIYLNWLIANSDLAQDAPPIGSIMPIAVDTSNYGNQLNLTGAGWMPCTGGPLNIKQFKALYDIIGTTYGGSKIIFNLPDLQGYFLVGAGNTKKLGAIQTVSTTGAPVKPITTDTAPEHTHTVANVPTDTHVIDVVAGVDLAENNPGSAPTSTDGAHTHNLLGGDHESRPANVYVDFVIRFR